MEQREALRQGLHEVTSFGVLHKESYWQAALNNLNKSSTDLYRQERDGEDFIFHVMLQSTHIWSLKKIINTY